MTFLRLQADRIDSDVTALKMERLSGESGFAGDGHLRCVYPDDLHAPSMDNEGTERDYVGSTRFCESIE
jgi:hypothetical protein